MEPVPVTRGVRSTVRVAVALVVGQALLCALIGWLTLGHTQSDAPDGSGVDRLALPPAGRPTVPSGESAAPRPPAATSGKPSRTVEPAREPRGRKRAAPTRTTPPVRKPSPPAPTTPVPASSPSVPVEPLPTLTAETTLGLVQEPVTVGERCWPWGSFGRTAEQTLVRCLQERRHPPRWKIV